MISFMEIANILRPKGDFGFLFTFVAFHFLSVWGLYFFNNFKGISLSQFMIHSYCFSVELSSLHCQKPDLMVFNQLNYYIIDD